jgi:AraC-like DNA-binding protein
LYIAGGGTFLAKIAARSIASGDGWSVADVVCSSGPNDRPFEEQHDHVAIAIVTLGSFQYRGSGAGPGRELMTPGSVLLGNAGQFFECGHEHAEGDRCLAFRYSSEYFAAITDGAHCGGRQRFASLRLPPLPTLSRVIAQACAAMDSSWSIAPTAWEEIAVNLAVQAVQIDSGCVSSQSPVSAAALARVTRAVRFIEAHAEEAPTLSVLAKEAGLSRFHFLRTFEDVTGVTPHRYLTRIRLRNAASRVLAARAKVLDVALDCGFGDVSNFNRAFRAEFSMSPRTFLRTSELRHGKPCAPPRSTSGG